MMLELYPRQRFLHSNCAIYYFLSFFPKKLLDEKMHKQQPVLLCKTARLRKCPTCGQFCFAKLLDEENFSFLHHYHFPLAPPPLKCPPPPLKPENEEPPPELLCPDDAPFQSSEYTSHLGKRPRLEHTETIKKNAKNIK